MNSIQEQQLQEKLLEWGFWTGDKIAYSLDKKDKELCVYLVDDFLSIQIFDHSKDDNLEFSVELYYEIFPIRIIYKNIKYLIDTL